MQVQAKYSKRQSTVPSVEDIPFYTPLKSRNNSLLSGHVCFCKQSQTFVGRKFVGAVEGGVPWRVVCRVGAVGNSHMNQSEGGEG